MAPGKENPPSVTEVELQPRKPKEVKDLNPFKDQEKPQLTEEEKKAVETEIQKEIDRLKAAITPLMMRVEHIEGILNAPRRMTNMTYEEFDHFTNEANKLRDKIQEHENLIAKLEDYKKNPEAYKRLQDRIQKAEKEMGPKNEKGYNVFEGLEGEELAKAFYSHFTAEELKKDGFAVMGQKAYPTKWGLMVTLNYRESDKYNVYFKDGRIAVTSKMGGTDFEMLLNTPSIDVLTNDPKNTLSTLQRAVSNRYTKEKNMDPKFQYDGNARYTFFRDRAWDGKF